MWLFLKSAKLWTGIWGSAAQWPTGAGGNEGTLDAVAGNLYGWGPGRQESAGTLGSLEEEQPRIG